MLITEGYFGYQFKSSSSMYNHLHKKIMYLFKVVLVLQRDEEYPSCTVELFYIVEYGIDPAIRPPSDR